MGSFPERRRGMKMRLRGLQAEISEPASEFCIEVFMKMQRKPALTA